MKYGFLMTQSGKMARISEQHSYIVLRDQQDLCGRGTLVVESRSDGVSEYQCHSHFEHQFLQTQLRISDSDLAPLDKKQCVILDAVSIDVRYTVYSTPELLEWGVGLKVGDTVLAKLPDRSSSRTGSSASGGYQYFKRWIGLGGSSGGDQYTTAFIKWIGEDSYGEHRFGVEITVSSLLYHHIMTSHHNHHFCIRTP